MDTPPVERDNGRFVKGHSGNPAGRPLNSKNTLAALRDELALVTIETVGTARFKKIITKLADKAEAGDTRAAKLLLDKMVPNATPIEADENVGRTVVFRIENATFAAQQQKIEHQPAPLEVIDVTPEQVSNEQQASS